MHCQQPSLSRIHSPDAYSPQLQGTIGPHAETRASAAAAMRSAYSCILLGRASKIT